MRFLFAFLTPLHRTHAPNFTLRQSNSVPFRPYSCIFFYSLSRKRLASPVLCPQNTSSKCHFQVFQELITSNGSALSIHYPKIPPNTFAAPFKSCAETFPNLEDVSIRGWNHAPFWETFPSVDGIMPHFGRHFHPWTVSCPILGDISARGRNHAPDWETFPHVDGIMPQIGRRFRTWTELCPRLGDVSIHIKTAQTTLLHEKKLFKTVIQFLTVNF